MHKTDSFDEFFTLVQRVFKGTTARSENDLSSKLSGLLKSLDLHTVVDTRVSTGGRKRPDILAYVSREDADLVLPAEVVIESKIPDEVREFADLAHAIVSEKYWLPKTFPYLRDNISRIQYFAFTTFTEFGVFPITAKIREAMIEAIKRDDSKCADLRREIKRSTLLFRIHDDKGRGSASARAWRQWLSDHLQPSALRPLNLSEARNSLPVRKEIELQELATRLSTFAAGLDLSSTPKAGLFNSIRNQLGTSYRLLSAEIRRDLLIFVMSQNVEMTTSEAEVRVKEDVPAALDEFVAASIHSLISRLFAIKVIEDVYCVGQTDPLVERHLWIFAIDDYDGSSPEQIRTHVFRRIRQLRDSGNPIIAGLVQYGFFFDWIEPFIDPILFRSLFETLTTHDFSEIEGDLLGRFYELYAQQTNRARRRALGQYYTPLPVVEFMWNQSVKLAKQRGEIERLTVLDPAMGSATFLAEGARVLSEERIERFWHRLTGFDISPQILGIAYVNLYMAVLSRVTPSTALEIDDLHLYATDTLDYENENHLKELLLVMTSDAHRLFLEQRVAISAQAKVEKSYRLVIGNPPYKNNSNLTLAQVAARFPRLLESSVEHGGAQLRNIRDDYAWFVSAADYYVRDAGMICFILSDSFASNRSYEHFRVELLKNYHIKMLVRLGTHIFMDVSPRTSFAVLLLERRAVPLESPSNNEPLPYLDLRSLIANSPVDQLGTPIDCRFLYLREVVSTGKEIEFTEQYVPEQSTRFSFYPVGDITSRFHGMPSLHDDKGAVLFIDTYPGIITAFDVLLKADTFEELQIRIASLFSFCHESKSGVELASRLNEWANDENYSDREREVLHFLGNQIAQKRISFDPDKIKRTFSGSIPENAKWFPPSEYVHYLYYEPALRVPRKENPGKQVGWGSMNQWREPLSHSITPKLIYTTARTTSHGYAAFVVSDEWYVKLHGGISQQFNYTGLDDPTRSIKMDGIPNNLTLSGESLFTALVNGGARPEALLYYVAGIWNSALSKELLGATGTSLRPTIKVPTNEAETTLVLKIASSARLACDLVHLMQIINANDSRISAEYLEERFAKSLFELLPIKQVVEKRKRYRSNVYYEISNGTSDRVMEILEETEASIDDTMELLYD